MFTVRQMRYFEALATTLHFRKAAETVHVSQPALSAQIAEMEDLAGAPLFERTQRSVIMTELGQILRPRIRAILLDIQALEDITAINKGLLSTRMRLGIIPTIAPYIVPLLIPRLRDQYPQFRLELREAMTARLLDDLNNGELDAVVAALPVDDDRLAHTPLFKDRFLIATASNDIDILDGPMTQDRVALDRLLLLEEGHCLREQALEFCTKPHQRQLVKYGATSMSTLLQMVSHGMGLTLIPEIAVRAEASHMKMRIIPFEGEQPSREIGMFWRKQSLRRSDFMALAQCITQTADQLKISEEELQKLSQTP
ncbi:LysR substrate-binding domain-containing protein [Brucellaceae bacterium C25G]